MHTPGAYLNGFRLLLAVFGAAVMTWALGLAVPPAAWAGGATARGAATYVLTLLAFAAAPRMRRDDVGGATLALLLLAEAGRAVVSRHLSLVLPAADLAGVAAAWAPASVEQFRRLARDARYVAFRDMVRGDRRGRAPSGTARAVLMR